MPVIHLCTEINAPVERCFDLARNIDFHQDAAMATRERAIAGVTTGLIKLGQMVTWKAKYFGIWRKATIQIIEMQPPAHFRDVMTEGDFPVFDHSHRFEFFDGKTIMRDVLYYESPLGLLGVMADHLFVKAYLRHFLQQRNRFLKVVAESELWKEYVDTKPASPVELLPVSLQPARRVGCAE